MTMATKPFPILIAFGSIEEFRAAGGPLLVCNIPWALIGPHAAQAKANHQQTLERLAERGGLSACEALAVLEDREWRAMPRLEAHAKLARLVISAGE